MLRMTIGSEEVEIRFDHKLCGPDEIESLTGICVDEARRCSFATANLNGAVVNVGMAICHPTDNFCRAIGRKKALADALRYFGKELRTAVWKEYKVMCTL